MYKWGFCVPDSSGNCSSLICYLLLQLTGKLLYLNTRNELPSTFSLKFKYSFLKKKGVCFQKTFSTVELKLNRKRPTLNLYWSVIQRSKVLNYSNKIITVLHNQLTQSSRWGLAKYGHWLFVCCSFTKPYPYFFKPHL